ncbi:MAG: GNAT family N-acetyltransferase [Fimbriimonas sp.]
MGKGISGWLKDFFYVGPTPVPKPDGTPSYPLYTERLLLRPPLAGDFNALYEMHSREDVARLMLWEPWTMEDTQTHLARDMKSPSFACRAANLSLVMVRRDSNALIGDINLHWADRQGSLGFALHPYHQGYGYATEAAELMLLLGFKHLHLHRIQSQCNARNEPSYRLMERLGMRREGLSIECWFIKGEWWDTLTYAILEREWEARQQAANNQ